MIDERRDLLHPEPDPLDHAAFGLGVRGHREDPPT
jgi:hypothetical protein